MSNFREINGSRMAVRKKFKLLIYEHIIYSFEARNLEILNQGGHKPGKLREFEKLSKSQGKLRKT